MADTITAKALAVMLTKALGRTVSPKQVRGRARGDSGTPVLARYGADVKGAYAHHAYSAAEAERIAQAFIKSHEARGGAKVRWNGLAGQRAVKRAATRPAPQAPTVDESATE